MAIEGFSVVGLCDRFNKKVDGGFEALSKIVPNATDIRDEKLWRCAFIAAADASLHQSMTTTSVADQAS